MHIPPVQARPPWSYGDLRAMMIHGFAYQENALDERRETGLGVRSLSQVCTPSPHLFNRVVACPLLLQISDDKYLAASREPLLRGAGFRVITFSTKQCELHLYPKCPAVVLLCQTVSAEKAVSFVTALQYHASHLLAVRVTQKIQSEPDLYHMLFEAPVAPAVLTREIAKLRDAIAYGS